MAQSGGYWSETRLNGQPLEKGTVCWVTLVPGQNPIATYGKSAQDVIDKLSLNQAHASAALARRSAAATSAPDATVTPVAVRQRLTPDEIFQKTEDIRNPAKAAEAITDLVQDSTGIDLRQIALQNYGAMAMRWQQSTPDFYDHPGNKRLLTEQAKMLVGGDLTMVTPEVLTQAFTALRNRGELYEAPVAMPSNPSAPSAASSSSTTIPFPSESPVQRTERPRGAPFATGTRSTGFRGGQTTPASTPKFTEAEIRKMPEARMRELNDPRHPDHAAYNDACELYFGQAARA